jgi:hypothetical protein
MDAQYLIKRGWIQTTKGWKKYGNAKMPACNLKHAMRVQKIFNIVDDANKSEYPLIERRVDNIVSVDFRSGRR